MRKSHIMMAGFAAVMAVAAPVAATGIAQAGTGSAHTVTRPARSLDRGCPLGYVCIYTLSGWANGTPEHTLNGYGCYGLSNETGEGVLFNNGRAIVRYGRNCFHPAEQLPPGQYRVVNFKLINAISLGP